MSGTAASTKELTAEGARVVTVAAGSIATAPAPQEPYTSAAGIVAAAQAQAWETLNLAANIPNPDEDLEEGWLRANGLDLVSGGGIPDAAFACGSVLNLTLKGAGLPALPPGIGRMAQLVELDRSTSPRTVSRRCRTSSARSSRCAASTSPRTGWRRCPNRSAR